MITQTTDNRRNAKISREFQARLSTLAPNESLRAIVLLNVPALNAPPPSRRAERQAYARTVQSAAEQLLPELDTLLARSHGQRLAEQPSILATIPVEITRDGAMTLAESDAVRAILEDQPLLTPAVSPRR